MKTKADIAKLMETIFADCTKTREDGQKEYAHKETNALANFERVAERIGITREQVLMVYLEKHIDGIHAWVNGHRSQREDVRGRIKDMIVYGVLLWGMADDLDEPDSVVRHAFTPEPCPITNLTNDCCLFGYGHPGRHSFQHD